MAVGSLLPELLASGQVPEDILRQMEAARDPGMGFNQPRQVDPRTAPRMGFMGGDVPPELLEQAATVAAGQPQQQHSSLPPGASPGWVNRSPQEIDFSGLERAQGGGFEEFKPGPNLPTYADLFSDNPAMGYAYLKSQGYPKHLYLNQIPLQGEDLKRFRRAEERRFDYWKSQKGVEDARLAREREERQARESRTAASRQSAAEAREARLAEKAEREKAQSARQDKARLEGSLIAADRAIEAARKAYSDTGMLSAGLIGGMTKWIPGSPALELNELIEPIRAITSFEQLNRMKEASRTGGALGQIAVRELELLSASVASMNTSQGPEQLKENLRKVVQHFMSWKEKAQRAWEVEGAPSEGTSESGGWTDDKERRYQELLRKRGGGGS